MTDIQLPLCHYKMQQHVLLQDTTTRTTTRHNFAWYLLLLGRLINTTRSNKYNKHYKRQPYHERLLKENCNVN